MVLRLTIMLFLGICVGIGAIVCTGSPPQYMNYSKQRAFSDKTSYAGMWLDGALHYIVFIPAGMEIPIRTSQYTAVTPALRGLTLIPEGLYLHAESVDISHSKVFMVQLDGSLKPIDKGPELYPDMRLANIMKLEESPAWSEVQVEIQSVGTDYQNYLHNGELSARIFFIERMAMKKDLQPQELILQMDEAELHAVRVLWKRMCMINEGRIFPRGAIYNDGRESGSLFAVNYDFPDGSSVTISSRSVGEKWTINMVSVPIGKNDKTYVLPCSTSTATE